MGLREWAVSAAVAVVGVGVGVLAVGLPESIPRQQVTVDPTLASADSAPSTTAPRPSTTTSTTTTAPPAPITDTADTFPPLERAAVRVLVANAGGRSGLAADGADRLRGIGYVDIATTNAIDTRESTLVLYATGREREALTLAADLGVPVAAVAQFTDVAVIEDPVGDADLVVLLARDLAL